MTVQQLLDILRITKQSLGRVLKELIDKGYVFQKEGETDRRQRLLHLTAEGEALRQRLMAPQIARIRRAVAQSNADAAHVYRIVLYNMVSPENRDSCSRLDRSGERRRRNGWRPWMISHTSSWSMMIAASANCSSPTSRAMVSG